MFNFNLLILLLEIIIKIHSEIILSFKTLQPTDLTEENYIQKIYDNNIYTEILIGTPEQKVKLFIKLDQFHSFITSKSCEKCIGEKFDETISSSYKLNSQNITVLSMPFNKLNIIQEKIKLGNIITEIQTFLVTELNEDYKYETGELSFALSSNIYIIGQEGNIIRQLKKNGKINDFVFSLQYISENEGQLILGDYLHNYDKKFTKENYTEVNIYMDPILDNYDWRIFFDKVYIGDNLKFEKSNGKLIYEFGLIIGSNDYYEFIKKEFFNKQNKCVEKEFLKNNFNHIYFECSKGIDKKLFPNLIFYNSVFKLNFTFTYNDLFINYKSKTFFLILFQNQNKKLINSWILGKPFIKKTNFYLNNDKKTIGKYPDIKSKSFSKVWILCIFLFIVIIIMFIYFKFYLMKNKRKIRANELEENFDYTPQQDLLTQEK